MTNTIVTKFREVLNMFIRDKHGRIALIQMPNVPLVSFFTSSILARVIHQSKLVHSFQMLAFGTLFAWAWLEVFQGASYARRTLGVLILAMLVWRTMST